MKKITLLILLLAFKINAQVSSYTFSTDTGGTVSSSGTSLGYQGTYYNSNANETYVINLPFTFYFNGNPFTSISACTNGFIRMGNTSSNGTTIFNNTSATNIIAGFNTGLKARARYHAGLDAFVTDGTFGYSSSGTAPNRVFTIYWNKFTNYSTAEDSNFNVNFNIKLYETTNVIEVVYGNVSPVGGAAQVGLKGASVNDVNARTTANNWVATVQSTSATATCLLSNTVKPTNGLIFRWTPPAITCDTPNNLAVTNILDTTATLSWENDLINSSNNFQYVVQPAGTGVPTSGFVALNNATTVGATNLTPETNYEVYVRKVCSYGKFSNWVGPVNFTTLSTELSTEDFYLNAIKMYPNPVVNTLSFTGDVVINKIRVYTILGQEVMYKDIANTTFNLDCTGLSEGTYFVTIETEKGKTVRKFIKKN